MTRIEEMKNDPSWNDWKWQMAHRIRSVDDLSRIIELSEQEKSNISRCLQRFRMAITPYYASLIRPGDKNDPIRMQAVPSIDETFACESDLCDPLNEEADSPVPCIVHRYPGQSAVSCNLCLLYVLQALHKAKSGRRGRQDHQ